jgi:quercetin dioxygenase-like cupin family protein
MKRKWVWALLLALMAVAVYAGTVLATSQSGVSTTFLANKVPFGEIEVNDHTIPADTWQGRIKTKGPSDGYVVDNVIHPGGTTGWHSHPGPSLIFVIRGAVTNYESDDPSCTGQIYSAGSGFVDAGGGDVHMLRNNGDVDAETIAVQLLPRDAPRRIEADAPANCSS